MRKFEKISFEQFKKDIKEDQELYNSYSLPTRKTKQSAGYDFESIIDILLPVGEIINIPLGIKATMNEGEVLFLLIRSSMASNYNIVLSNQVGVVDMDYYNNSVNEGHIFVSVQNQGKENFQIHKGDRICQGVFTYFLKVEDEEINDNPRTGGFGSTGKGADASA